ncbi:MAG TPA: hypothetical protein VMJ10_37290 [Kofleriaceae bacterium]|nr:hypothetical protein [Kofleriaceae bacterium]
MVPALIVGALTAWYLGLRLGIIIAVATAVALLVANFVPGMTITVYALVIAWAAAMYFFGPKIAKASGKTPMFSGVTGAVGQASSWVRNVLGKRDRG